MIPEAAVAAAAKRIYLDGPTGRRTCEAWEGMDDGAQSYYRLDARRILEAAAPHMLIHVHHHDIENHARSYNEGYEAAMSQMVEG